MAVKPHTLHEIFHTFSKATGNNTAIANFRIVEFHTDGNVRQAGARSKKIVGVTTGGADNDADLVSVALLGAGGIHAAAAGASVDEGDSLTTDSQGRVVEATTGQQYFAIALEDQATVGQPVRFVVVPGGTV